MKQRIKKQFWLSPQDARELKRKAKLCGITETAVIRILLRGYEPKEKPDTRFYEALRWHKFQADIEAVFLRPGESNLKWQ